MAVALPRERTKKRAIQMDARRLCFGPERLDRPGRPILPHGWPGRHMHVPILALSRAAAGSRSFCLRVSRWACGSPPNACTFGDRTAGRTAGSLSQHSVSVILLHWRLYHNTAGRTQPGPKTQPYRQLTFAGIVLNSVVFSLVCAVPRRIPVEVK